MSLATPLMSERARAWLASVKDVPPDQIAQHATAAAQTGMISFGDAIALKQMADRISGAAQQKDAPSPTSVVQDLKQQIQAPQQPQEVDMPADPRMQGGIATLPAPAMDNVGDEASMAGGGIVAFAGAGLTNNPDPWAGIGGYKGTGPLGNNNNITPEQIAEAMRNPLYQQLVPRVMHQESGGNPNAVSPKGAVGTMQVMPKTLGNPGFGVTPARNNSAAERERVGKEYLAAMLIRSKWDVPAALQMYNAGPGAADKIAAGTKSLPAETRNYVRNITQGAPQTPQDPRYAGIASVAPTGRRRFLADVLRPGAAPATPEEAADFDKAYGPNWRTKYQGMTHSTGYEVTNNTVRRGPEVPTQPARTAPPTATQAPVATEATRVADDAPLLNAIDVDAEMKKEGMSKQDRLLMLANAGFKMAQAASQPGAKFLGSAAVGGGEAAQGLAALNADKRSQRRALQDAAYKREEALAALGLKQRELDISERLGLGKISSDALKNSAALASVRLKAEEFLKTDPQAVQAVSVMEEERENAEKHPNSASAIRYKAAKALYEGRMQQVMGNVLLSQQVAEVTGAHPGYSAD